MKLKKLAFNLILGFGFLFILLTLQDAYENYVWPDHPKRVWHP